MNDTTKWIMIILLLLLIAAAVFMLLRSPGKDANDAVDSLERDSADRGVVPDAREGRISPDSTTDRGVYDQEADTAGGAVAAGTVDDGTVDDGTVDDGTVHGTVEETHQFTDGTTYADDTTAESTYAEETTTYDTSDDQAADEGAEPYQPAAGAYEDTTATETTYAEDTAYAEDTTATDAAYAQDTTTDATYAEDTTTDATYAEDTTATDTAYAEDEPTASETTYAEETTTTDSAWDADGPDVAAAAAAGAAGAAGLAAAGAAPAEAPQAETVDAQADTADVVDVEPLTDEEIQAGSRTEPLDVEDQEPGVSPEGVATDDMTTDDVATDDVAADGMTADAVYAGEAPTDDTTTTDTTASGWDAEGPDVGQAAALGAGAAAAGAGGAAGSTFHQDTLPTDEHAAATPEYPVGEETTYRAEAGEAVAVEDTSSTGVEEAAARGAGYEHPDTSTVEADASTVEADASTVDSGNGSMDADVTAPADAGYAPQTAEEIAEGGAYGAEESSTTDQTATFTEAAYGPGSAMPAEDGSGPAGWAIKGNAGSMLFHTEESPSYDAVRAEVWFESEEAARAAGFAHWDRRRR